DEIFFFQAEDGIRDKLVTGVQRVLFRSKGSSKSRARDLVSYAIRSVTSSKRRRTFLLPPKSYAVLVCATECGFMAKRAGGTAAQIGRASCRGRGEITVVGDGLDRQRDVQ